MIKVAVVMVVVVALLRVMLVKFIISIYCWRNVLMVQVIKTNFEVVDGLTNDFSVDVSF